jgi:hypothetical protein
MQKDGGLLDNIFKVYGWLWGKGILCWERRIIV